MREDSVRDFLLAVEQRMRDEIARTPAAEPARELMEAGGKRLRARLVWLSAQSTAPQRVESNYDRLVCAAAAIEFAHLGSLIHDDIADGSDTRRGISTIHRRYNLVTAVDAGAVLAHLASGMVATLGSASRLAVRRAILATCRGQIRELATPYTLVSFRVRLAVMQEKTAAFFELAATLGALLAGADRIDRAQVCRFARRFGIAFQIADDVLDLTGDPGELGRPNGADLREGVPTLPLLLAATTHDDVAKSFVRLRQSPTSDAIANCAELVRRGGGVAAARAAAVWWLQESFASLRKLPANAGTSALRELANASIARGLRTGGRCVFVGVATAAFEGRGWLTTATTAPLEGRMIIHPRLARVLDWFQGGLSGVINQLAQASVIRDSWNWARQYLTEARLASEKAAVASDALALAYALTEHTVEQDPPRNLALIDSLYCASIGELCAAPLLEHRQLARRARALMITYRRKSAANAPMARVVSQLEVSLSA